MHISNPSQTGNSFLYLIEIPIYPRPPYTIGNYTLNRLFGSPPSTHLKFPICKKAVDICMCSYLVYVIFIILPPIIPSVWQIECCSKFLRRAFKTLALLRVQFWLTQNGGGVQEWTVYILMAGDLFKKH